MPLLDPLLYPGRAVAEPSLLVGDVLRPLAPVTVAELRAEGRIPVLAVGSNAAPAQVRHKFAVGGVSGTVPMVPVRVGGLAVGHSGHVSVAGYVAYTPYAAPGRWAELVLLWLDGEQLRVVDASERANYRRLRLAGERFPVDGGPGDVDVYVSERGLLAGRGGGVRPAGGQREVMGELLRGSARLRAVLGASPEEWVRRVAADHRLGAEASRVLRDEGLTLPNPLARSG
ncbi:hypothetical protein [Streptomyces sp. JJ38]|uniref:hypothetical protein n=1 Tax=Streptomyces sp. JJ38 TaxID=2738128 RepID=UPI001C5A170D|nr:hypothetical protein [Streptomyces sp. JJ38]MBW1599983.1 hypothetical protein [Streptomyces sp. JJ38]